MQPMHRVPLRCHWLVAICTAAALLAPILAPAQQAPTRRSPHIACVFPAGARPGQNVTLKLAGQFLEGVNGLELTGAAVQTRLIEYQRPLTGRELNLFRDRVRELQRALSRADAGQTQIQIRNESDTNRIETLSRQTAEKQLAELRRKLANPKNRARDNPQLAEDVWLEARLPTNALPGRYELRLRTALGLSNPLLFHIVPWPEVLEKEPNDKIAEATPALAQPAVLNGQIQAGDVDYFRLRLRRGMQWIALVQARELIPYLADAVPGWFQAVLTLYDSDGREIAYADDDHFNPDPVLQCTIPQDGEYILAIRDALFRGREDFVYRIVTGELPWVTKAFPLGARAGVKTIIQLEGWNLPTNRLVLAPANTGSDRIVVNELAGVPLLKPLQFALSDLTENTEIEPNDTPQTAQHVELPIVINGLIQQPGDTDRFRFTGHAGQRIVAEVIARRLDSPLDSFLILRDAYGRTLAANDDTEDRATGLLPHQADARIETTLPADGDYTLELFDTQRHGGPAWAYRLRLSEPRPDFALRATPSALNVRPGGSVSFTLHLIRYDGFTNEVTVVLRDAPSGFRLNAPTLRGTNTAVTASLTVPFSAPRTPTRITLEGCANLAGRTLLRPVLPADEQTQAFFIQHLVPAQELLVFTTARARPAGARRP